MPAPPARPPVHTDPLAALLQVLAQGGGARLVVGLAGLPGAGKTTLTARLAAQVNATCHAPVACALGMDGFHLSRAALARRPDAQAALARRGAPWTFDPQALRARLLALRAQADTDVPWPGFAHEVGDPVEAAIRVAPGIRLVLLEGLYLLHHGHGWDLRGCMDQCWYLDVPMDLALARLAARHQRVFGLTAEQARARIVANDARNAAIVAATRCRADAWLCG